MPLPPSDHPLWKILHLGIAVVGVTILITHGVEGTHAAGLDTEDAAGMVGVASAARLFWTALK